MLQQKRDLQDEFEDNIFYLIVKYCSDRSMSTVLARSCKSR